MLRTSSKRILPNGGEQVWSTMIDIQKNTFSVKHDVCFALKIRLYMGKQTCLKMKEKWVPLQDGPLVINGISPILMGNCSYNFPTLLTGGIIRPNQPRFFFALPKYLSHEKNTLTFQVYWLFNRCNTLPYKYKFIYITYILYPTQLGFCSWLTWIQLHPCWVHLTWWRSAGGRIYLPRFCQRPRRRSRPAITGERKETHALKSSTGGIGNMGGNYPTLLMKLIHPHFIRLHSHGQQLQNVGKTREALSLCGLGSPSRKTMAQLLYFGTDSLR